MPSVKPHPNSPKRFQPHLVILDGVRKLILAKKKASPINIFLTHVDEEEEYTGEEFTLIFSIPEEEKKNIVVSLPIERKVAKTLYEKFKQKVSKRGLPNKIRNKLN